MIEVEFSTMVNPICLDLPAFEQRSFIKTRLKPMDWATGWNNVLQIGLYQKGPDLSEVGSTWMENLNDMRALRPFSQSELNALGGEAAYLPAAWPASDPSQGPRRISSIPWMLDTRLVYYRKDLLAQAGIDAASAFDTPDAFYETLRRLQANGMRHPLAMATAGLSIHNMASWVWGRGGRFRSPDYHKVTLVEPEGRQGMQDYFRLHPFIAPEARGGDYSGADQHYYNGKAAVLLSGEWVIRAIKNRWDAIQPVVQENTGLAMAPGVPYVGATHLVIWKHTIHDSQALQLLMHLLSPTVLNNIFQQNGNFPARLDVLNSPLYTNDPDLKIVIESLQKGRAFRSARLWAGVEMRLNTLHDQLWADLFANPALDLPAEIERRVRELATRLERTLLANW